MEARAVAKHVRVSPRKARQVIDEIRGQNVNSALNLLQFTPRYVAKTLNKLLKSAVANAVNMEGKVDVDSLFVKEAWVGPGPTLKRWLPRAQGRATPILKRTSHITIIVDVREPQHK
jgi:large subunit ribosomal protein L22